MDLFQLLGGAVNRALTAGPRKWVDDQHQRYESAFDRGDFNSPDILGVDPAMFGYPADELPSKTRRQLPARANVLDGVLGGFPSREQMSRTPNITGAYNPLSRYTRTGGATLFSPGEGPLTNLKRNR